MKFNSQFLCSKTYCKKSFALQILITYCLHHFPVSKKDSPFFSLETQSPFVQRAKGTKGRHWPPGLRVRQFVVPLFLCLKTATAPSRTWQEGAGFSIVL